MSRRESAIWCVIGAFLALLPSNSMEGAEAPPETAAGEREADVAELIRRLPTNRQAGAPDTELEARIAGLGQRAIPALEKELRLGIPFKSLDRLFKTKGSRRWAVVRVLARIPGKRSTELLVRSLSDTPDNVAMREATLRALEGRLLSDKQVVRLIGNREPQVVLAGIAHAVPRMARPTIERAVEWIFDKDVAVQQFKNEYGNPTANADGLWEIRLAAGRALKRDMVAETRGRATQVLGELKAEALSPTEPDRSAFMSYASPAELAICRSLSKLAALGQPVKDLVEREAETAEGDHAKVLDMALALLGDRSRIARVAAHLNESSSHTMRFCACSTLRRLRDRLAIPALKKALRDPYHRQDGSCQRIGDGEIWPVRVVAAGALIDLGEDPKKVREIMHREK